MHNTEITGLRAIENEKIKKYYLQSTYILSRSLESWYSKPENKHKEPHIHIKIYDKISRQQMFENKRIWAYEKLLSDQKKLKESFHNDVKFNDSKYDDDSVESNEDGNDDKKNTRREKRKRRRDKIKNRRLLIQTTNKVIDSKVDDNVNISSKTRVNIYEELKVTEEEITLNEFDDLSISTEVVPDELTATSFEQDGKERKIAWNNAGKFWKCNPVDEKQEDFDEILEEFKEIVKVEMNSKIVSDKLNEEKKLIGELEAKLELRKKLKEELKEVITFPQGIISDGVRKYFLFKLGANKEVLDIKFVTNTDSTLLEQLDYVMVDNPSLVVNNNRFFFS